MHVNDFFRLLLLATATMAAGLNICAAQSAAETAADQAVQQRADALLKQMTPDEKLQFLISKYPFIASPGGGAGFVAGVPRLNIPDISNSDSATGSGSKTQSSTTFPSTLAIAASWDRQLSFDYG